MSVTHPVTVRNTLANSVVDLLDLGAGPGTLELQSASNAVVSIVTFSKPAFGNAASGTATAASIAGDPSAIGGTVAKAAGFDSNHNQVFACSVTGTGGGGDIELSNVVVSNGQAVSITSLTYSAPP